MSRRVRIVCIALALAAGAVAGLALWIAAPLPLELAEHRAGPDDPATAALEAESTRAALALIAELPPDQAEVVALRVLGGMSVDEVARIIGKRPGAVRVLAHRGLRRLAQRLESAGLAGRRVTK